MSQKNITPNQISIMSLVFAAAAAICLILLSHLSGLFNWILPLLAALFIQMRLVCNLLDGMVAIEGGKTTKSGELFNDIPDRIADPLILIAAGYAVGNIIEFSDVVGWCAGLLAVMTAYIRTLCVSIGAPANFSGPMAKQQRMALITFACLLTSLETLIWQQGYILFAALFLIIVGCVMTIYRRILSAYQYLEGKSNDI